MKSNIRFSIKLFLNFLRIGAFTFGGGWSIVAQMQEQYVEKEHLLSAEELVDITSVGRSLPGTMVANVAFLFGYRCGGILCALAAVTGLIIPPLVILGIVTVFYNAVKANLYISHAMSGVRAAVAPIILVSLATLRKGAFTKPFCYVLCAGAAMLNLFFGTNCVVLILVGAVCGIVMCRGEDAE